MYREEKETMSRFNQTNNVVGRPQSVADMDYVLSAVHIELEIDEFEGVLAQYPGNDEFKKLRKERADLFVRRTRGRAANEQILLVPLAPETKLESARPLPVADYLDDIRALIAYRLPSAMPQFELQPRRFHTERISREKDILDRAFKRANIARPKECEGFHKFQRTAMKIQKIDQPGRKPSLCLTMSIGQKYEIEVPIHELITRKFDLTDCWVYDPAKHGREKWMGRVKRIDGAWLVVEGANGNRNLPLNGSYEYRIDARRDAFRRLLLQKLGSGRFAALERAEDMVLTNNFSGDGYLRKLSDYADKFTEMGALEAAPSVRFRFNGLVDAERPQQVHRIRKTQYCFSDDGKNRDEWPSNGLKEFGPFRQCKDTLKVLVAFPTESESDVKQFVEKLLHGHKGYGPLQAGFLRIFGIADVVTQWLPVEYAHGVRAEANCYVRAIEEHWDPDDRPDVALVFQRHRADIRERFDPYIATKAYLLTNGVPSQEILMATATKGGQQLPYILENVAIAMHAKLGGIPWTIVPVERNVHEIVIGMAHAETAGDRFVERKRYMGITTVFSNDGTYLFKAATGRCLFEEYPAELEQSVKKTIQRLQEELNWRKGARVRLVIHTRMPLRNTDVAAIWRSATRELRTGIDFEIACLMVHRDHPWKVLDPKTRTVDAQKDFALIKGARVPARGTTVDLGGNKWLLCLKDPSQMLRASEPVPQPLSVELHCGSRFDAANMKALVTQVLDFSALSWRTTRTISEPVTTYYAHLIAEKLNALESVDGWSDAALDSQLARSAWFL